MSALGPDILRLVLLPILAWAAWHDWRTRRVPRGLRRTLIISAIVLGTLAASWESVLRQSAPERVTTPPTPDYLPVLTWGLRQLPVVGDRLEMLLNPAAVNVFLVLLFAVIGLQWWKIGGADALGMVAIAVVFPTAPRYTIAGIHLPISLPPYGFPLAVLIHTIGLWLVTSIIWHSVTNFHRGDIARIMWLGKRVHWTDLKTTHGNIIETPAGYSYWGLDLDVLRMFLPWREVTLAELRAHPELRTPTTLPTTLPEIDDGRVHPEPTRKSIFDTGPWSDSSQGQPTGDRTNELTRPHDVDHDADATLTTASTAEPPSDSWGADAFLAGLDVQNETVDTTPEQLRSVLELLMDRETVWAQPGTPFLVWLVIGLVLTFVCGDLPACLATLM